MARLSTRSEIGPLQTLRAQWQVIFALILRDIRTRWGSTPAYITTFLFPLVHIFVLVGIWVGAGRLAPYGESTVLWFAVSMIPFMAFSYVSRFLIVHVLHNKVVLSFPAFKLTDVIFSGLIIEILNISVVVSIVFGILWYTGVEFYPSNLNQALLAIVASVMLGLGAGIFNALIGLMVPMWVTGYFLTVILIWLTSSVMFLPSALPEKVLDFLFFQPVVHLVEWMREAYYPSYVSPILNKYFVFGYALFLIASGLAIERFARGRVIMN